jgi:hypothetical protein
MDDKKRIFSVLDEAQETTMMRMGEFRSEGDPLVKRPLLQTVWRAWAYALSGKLSVVLSGMGIKLMLLRETLGTDLFKSVEYKLVHDTGAFDDPHSQAKYIKHYIPANWADPAWMEFLKRSWGWCHGR